MESANILLINTDTCSFAKVYPIGLDYLSSVLCNHGYLVDKLDLAFIDKKEWLPEIIKKLTKRKYLAIGIGIRNLYDELYNGKNYLPEIFQLTRSIKKLIRRNQLTTKIILGGSGFSLMPNTILNQTEADYGVINEGEQALLTILKKIDRKENLSYKIFFESVDVSSQIYKRGLWGNFHGYFKLLGSGNLQTKRGCPMRCLYCEYPAIEGSRFRFRNPEIVAEEFLQLEKLGFPRVYIVDATFNNPTYQAKQVLTAFKKAGTKKEWVAFFNPKLLDQDLLELIKATNGGKPLKITIESGSDIMLQNLQKGFRQPDIFKAAALCQKNSMDFSFTVLLGGPGETKKTIQETCNVIKKCKPAHVSMNIGIFLHPKTQIAVSTQGKLWQDENDFINPIVYPCDREKIKKWVGEGLSGSGIPYHIYSGEET